MRRILALTLLLACAADGGDEAKTPLLIYREPDPSTRKEIETKLISQEGIGSSTQAARVRARARLTEIGAWAVPYLRREVERAMGERVPMNATMVLARILDPDALPEIRG